MKAAVADYRYRVLCLRIVPVAGDPVLITHHPRQLKMSNGQVYLPHAGYESSAYTATTSMSASTVDLSGIATTAGITEDRLSDGYFDDARAYLFATTWRNPVEDEEPIVASFLGRTTIKDGKYTIEEMSLIDALGQSVGKTYSANCKKKFGGQEYAGCTKDLAPLTVTGTITTATSRAIMVDTSRTEAADYFGLGTIAFTTGPNVGLKPKEIKSFQVGGTFEVFEPFYYPVSVGDAYVATPGCRRTMAACKAWSNILNFGGFSFVPVSSIYSDIGTK